MENKIKPIMDPLLLHGEQEQSPVDINKMVGDIFIDLKVLNDNMCQTANNIKSFMEDVKIRLADVEQTIIEEQERQQDINMLCNNYSDFNLVVNMTTDDFNGNFSANGNIFMMDCTNNNEVPVTINNISGNGFEGNKYVYTNGQFQNEVIDTSNRGYITDSSMLTMYEYTRITADTTETDVPPEINFDSIEAICSIILQSNSYINTIKLVSDSKDLKLLSVEISDDGAKFTQVNKETYDIKNRFKKYNIDNYIPDSGIVCFPETKYVKLIIQSSGYTLDTIAFNKTVIE